MRMKNSEQIKSFGSKIAQYDRKINFSTFHSGYFWACVFWAISVNSTDYSFALDSNAEFCIVCEFSAYVRSKSPFHSRNVWDWTTLGVPERFRSNRIGFYPKIFPKFEIGPTTLCLHTTDCVRHTLTGTFLKKKLEKTSSVLATYSKSVF